MWVMDSSIAVLIVLVAGYAGAAVWTARGIGPGAVAAAGVAASFALMLGLARVWVPATFAVAVLFATAVTFLTLSGDLGASRAGVTATVIGLFVGAAFAFVSYLALMALIGAAGIYLVLRRWVRTRPALVVTGGALGTLLAGSAAAFAVALSGM
jgi:hypothetical protein